MRIGLVDFSHMLSVNYHARANDGGPNYAAEATMTELSGLRQHFDRVIVCYDKKPYFRRERFPGYKSHREEAAPELVRLWKLCAEKVRREYQIAQADSFEGDDCAATLAKIYSEGGHSVEIVGADKDALQCVRDSTLNKRDDMRQHGSVSVRVLGHGGVADEIRGTEYVRKKYGVEPEQLPLLQAIMGDASDNIPGIPGLGEKKGATLIATYAPKDPVQRFDLKRTIINARVALSRAVADAESAIKELPAHWKTFADFHIQQRNSDGTFLEITPNGKGKKPVPVLGLELLLELTTLRTDVPIDAAALLEPKTREPAPVPASMQREPGEDDGEWGDHPTSDAEREESAVDWDSIAADEEAKTAAELAAQSANDDGGEALANALNGEKPVDDLITPASDLKPPAAELPSNSPYKARSGPAFTRRPLKSCDLHEDCDKAEAEEMAEAKRRGHEWKTDVKHDYTEHDKRVYSGVRAPEAETRAANMATAKIAQTEAEQRKSEPPPKPEASSPTTQTATKHAATPPTVGASPAAAPHTPAQPVGTAANGAGAGSVPSQVVPPNQGPPKPTASEALAIPVLPAPSWSLQVQPVTLNDMKKAAMSLWDSGRYRNHESPPGIFAVAMLGRELGMGMMTALESFHVVKDRPFAKATTLKALAEKHPDCEWIMVTHADDKSATIKTKHRKIPDVLEYTYTIERAKAAGYLDGNNRDNWRTKTQEMLEARATSKGVRRWYPSCTMGMHAEEEAHDD